MKKRKVTAIAALVLLGGLTLFTGCSEEEKEKTEITFIHGWGAMDADHVNMRKIYEEFQNNNPDIQLNMVSMPSSDDVISKTEEMLSVGEIPDIVFTGGTGVDSLYEFMVQKEYALDMMPYIEDDEEFKGDIAEENLKYWTTAEGNLYTIADVQLLCGYWFNTKIFEAAGINEIPKTWSELEEDCKKIKIWSDENEMDVFPMMPETDNYIYFADALLLDQGGVTARKIMDGNVILQSGAFLEMLEQLKNIYPYTYNGQEKYTYRDSLQNFNDEKSAIYINGVWANTMIADDIDVKYATFPSSSGKSVSCLAVSAGYILGNTKDQDKIDASIRFIKYMLSDKVQREILETTGQVPANPFIDISQYKDMNPRLVQAVEVVNNADIKIETPDNLWTLKQKQAFSDHILDVLSEKMDSSEFVNILKNEG